MTEHFEFKTQLERKSPFDKSGEDELVKLMKTKLCAEDEQTKS